MTAETDRAKQLARDHWGYIETTLSVHGIQQEELSIIMHHYTTAMIHGFKHGIESERKGEFRPRIGSDFIAEEVEAISKRFVGPCAAYDDFPRTAEDCANYDTKTCDHSDCKHCRSYEKDPGPIGGQITETKESLCASCSPGICTTKQMDETGRQGRCAFKSETKEPQALDLSLPTITICCTPRQILEKFKEEVEEYEDATPGGMAQLIEAWDVIQVAQTYRDHGGCSHDVEVSMIAINLRDWYEAGRPVMAAKRAMEIKNASRGYYSDEDNARILATV